MTQQSFQWLVTAPEGKNLTDLLTIACRGNDKIGTLLYAFLRKAGVVAHYTGLNRDQIDHVQIAWEHSEIATEMEELHRKTSVPTLIKWIKKLVDWGFLIADGYRHQYAVYFRKVIETFSNPPEKEVPPPRGRHAHRNKDLTLEGNTSEDLSLENSTSDQDLTFKGEDLTFDYRNGALETLIQPQNSEVETLILLEEIKKVKSENELFKSEIKKVKSELSHERACRLALEAKVDALYNIIDINLNIKEKKEESPPPPDGSFIPSSNSHFSSAEEGVPPASVGVSLSTANSGGDAPTNVAGSSPMEDTQPLSPDPTAQGCALPIAEHETAGSTTQDSEVEPPDSDASSNVCQQSVNETAELGEITQEILLDWMNKAGVGVGRFDPQKATDILRTSCVTSYDGFTALVTIERARHPMGPIWLANLVKPEVLAKLQETQEQPEIAPFVGMTRDQADTFAQWLMQQPGYCWEVVAIDKTYPDREVWSVCVQYAPDRWLYFESPEHFRNPSFWERERIEDAKGYALKFAQPMEVAI